MVSSGASSRKLAWSHRTARAHLPGSTWPQLLKDSAGPSVEAFLPFLPPLPNLSSLATCCPNTSSVPGTFGSWEHKVKSSGGSTGRGIPWREASPPCHSLLWSLWIAICNLAVAAPCQGPGHSGFTHTLLSVHIIPQLSILRSKYAIFSSL